MNLPSGRDTSEASGSDLGGMTGNRGNKGTKEQREQREQGNSGTLAFLLTANKRRLGKREAATSLCASQRQCPSTPAALWEQERGASRMFPLFRLFPFDPLLDFAVGERLAAHVFDAVHDLALVVGAQEVDAVAGGVAAVPVLVDVLSHAEGGHGEVVGEAEESRLVLDVDVLATHEALEVGTQLGVGEVVLAGLHDDAGAADLAQELGHAPGGLSHPDAEG